MTIREALPVGETKRRKYPRERAGLTTGQVMKRLGLASRTTVFNLERQGLIRRVVNAPLDDDRRSWVEWDESTVESEAARRREYHQRLAQSLGHS